MTTTTQTRTTTPAPIRKPLTRSPRILVLPGIGDIHWVFLKLEGVMDRWYPGWRDKFPPEIHIWDMDQRRRSEDFIRRVPWVKFGGYYNTTPVPGDRVFSKMYTTGGLDYIRDFNGYDAFLCFNGSLRQGMSLEGIMDEAPINWNYHMSIASPKDIEWAKGIRFDGKYILCYFSDHGMFKHWLAKWGTKHIAAFLQQVKRASGCQLILTGSSWDNEFAAAVATSVNRNLVGRTSFNQLLELIRCASGFVGWPGGNTILSPYLGTKTAILWCKYFPEHNFLYNWVNPDDYMYPNKQKYQGVYIENYPSLGEAVEHGDHIGKWMKS